MSSALLNEQGFELRCYKLAKPSKPSSFVLRGFEIASTSDNMQTYTINIRPRRQATFPRELLEKLGVDVGDDFEAYTKGKKLVLKPKKQIAMDAFKELQKAVQESGISEKEMLKNLDKIRREQANENS